MKQAMPELRFEVLYLAAQNRVGNVQLQGRFGETAGLGDSDEVCDLSEIQHGRCAKNEQLPSRFSTNAEYSGEYHSSSPSDGGHRPGCGSRWAPRHHG